MKRRVPIWLTEAAVLTVAVVEALTAFPEPTVVTANVIAVLVLIARHRWPVLAFVVTLPAVVLANAMIPAIIGLYTVSLRYRSWWLVGGCGLLVTGANVFPLIELAEFSTLSYLALGVIYATMTAVAPVLLGRFLHTQRELELRLAEVRQAREHERRLDAEAILTQERNQLAREMHDVVSHQVSLIAVQAGALKVTTTDPAVQDAAESVRRLSVNTLDELRHMVNLLRASGTPGTELTPQPTLTDLERLMSGSGLDARLTGGAPEGVDQPVQRAIYRTIQEALTNVRKHAPGATATVDISHDDTDLTVTVTNTRPTRPTLALPSARHGLVGLQERATLLGGSIDTGPTPDGGFRLRLRLPLTTAGGPARN